jgi:hypothetical protein
VAIQNTIDDTNTRLIIYLYTGNMIYNETIGHEVDEVFHVASIWPKKIDEQEEVLKTSLASLMDYYEKNAVHKEKHHG